MRIEIIRYLLEYDKGNISNEELYKICRHIEIQAAPVLDNYSKALSQLAAVTLEYDKLLDSYRHLKEALRRQTEKCLRQRLALSKLNAKLYRINRENEQEEEEEEC